MTENLKSRAINGAFWKVFEKICVQLAHFFIGIVLARLLMPSDYGIVGMLSIFLSLASAFQDCGFAKALIRKKDITQDDLSTAFFFNAAISILIYMLLYISAPHIANFYHTPILKDVTRVAAIIVVIQGLTSVLYTKMDIDLQFRSRSLLTISGVIITGIVGIVLAYNGFGVWSLVYQGIASSIIVGIFLWIISSWKPSFTFSIASLKYLIGFGSSLLTTNTINIIYNNLYTLVIGRYFSPTMVGLYNRANGYARIPCNTLIDLSAGVMYPILSKFQDDDSKLIRAYSKLLSVPSYILYPLLSFMLVMADPLIEVLIGSQWLPCATFMKLLCIGYMFLPLNSINLNLLYVKGRADLALKLEFVKKPIGIIILFATIPLGITWMIVGRSFYSMCVFFFNCHYTNKILNYGFMKQLKALLPIMLNSAVMGFVCYIFTVNISENIIKLIAGFIISLITYIALSTWQKDESFIEIKKICLSRMLKKT